MQIFLKGSSRISTIILLVFFGCVVSMVNIIPTSHVHNEPGTVFPGAEGFGTDTTAGRGGQIIKVTNLNDSGSGSLRAAIEASGPRTVVFEVGGTIALLTDLIIDDPFITIAGQSSPSPGIMLRNAGIQVRTHDVLIQHLRIRVGDAPEGPDPTNRDALQIIGNPSFNVVIDHVSASWAIDENMSTWYPVENITISNCIISEALYDSLHSKGPHSMGLLIGDHAKNVTVVGNLLASNNYRMPRVTGDASVVILNNVSYNSGDGYAFAALGGAGPVQVSAVGNIFQYGPDTRSNALTMHLEAGNTEGSSVYYSDNHASSSIGFTYDTSFDPRVSSPPVWHSSLTVRDSSTVENWVLSNAGARPADRDVVDERVVSEVSSRSGYMINSQSEVGGWPDLQSTYRAFTIPANPNGDDDGDGYTNVEEILSQMAATVEGR